MTTAIIIIALVVVINHFRIRSIRRNESETKREVSAIRGIMQRGYDELKEKDSNNQEVINITYDAIDALAEHLGLAIRYRDVPAQTTPKKREWKVEKLSKSKK